MCDASAAVPLDERRFVAADDEDNVLRAYDSRSPGSAAGRRTAGGSARRRFRDFSALCFRPCA